MATAKSQRHELNERREHLLNDLKALQGQVLDEEGRLKAVEQFVPEAASDNALDLTTFESDLDLSEGYIGDLKREAGLLAEHDRKLRASSRFAWPRMPRFPQNMRATGAAALGRCKTGAMGFSNWLFLAIAVVCIGFVVGNYRNEIADYSKGLFAKDKPATSNEQRAPESSDYQVQARKTTEEMENLRKQMKKIRDDNK